MSIFEIMISDEQRDLIVSALSQSNDPETIDLREMFAALRDDETNVSIDPETGVRRGVLHSFIH